MKPVAFATAKLMPLRLRSRGTPGMSRGYGDVVSNHRPFTGHTL
jgi:hypothetical protein